VISGARRVGCAAVAFFVDVHRVLPVGGVLNAERDPHAARDGGELRAAAQLRAALRFYLRAEGRGLAGGDFAAADARPGVASGLTPGVLLRVQHDRTADEAHRVARLQVGSLDRDLLGARAVRADGDVAQIAEVLLRRLGQPVGVTFGAEMVARARGIRRAAVGFLMDVQAALARRGAADLHRDLRPAVDLGQGCRAGGLGAAARLDRNLNDARSRRWLARGALLRRGRRWSRLRFGGRGRRWWWRRGARRGLIGRWTPAAEDRHRNGADERHPLSK